MRSDRQAVHIYFEGLVQGVGFRFTAHTLAQKHRIVGWVRNTSDGKVELSAQAPSKRLEGFLHELREVFNRNITHIEQEESALTQGLDNFRIIF